jgi:hypothetical protein
MGDELFNDQANANRKEMDDFIARCEKEGIPETAEEQRKRGAAILQRCNDRSLSLLQALHRSPSQA